MDHIIVLVATGVYSGMLPFIPGLWGSLLALPLWYFCRNLALSVYLGLTTGLFFIGCMVAERAEKIFAQKDASAIVVDEILGIFIALIPVLKIRLGWIFGFIAFIILDGLKPFPASILDTQLPGGLGIMMDDLVVGFYALLFLNILIFFLSRTKQR
jgi:phosphatidylglycerophosphatase A